MPSKDRISEYYRRLLEAALDQRKPSAELVEASNRLLDSLEHKDREVL